jgi:transposase
MASLTAKTIRGRKYYYLRETARVDGKPKVVRQTYLGSAEAVAAALGKGSSTLEIREGLPVRDFGAVAALHDLVGELGLVELVDQHVPRRVRRGPSVGQLLALASINRVVAPASKAHLGAWYEGTVLPRLLGFKQSQLTSQRFWDAMDRVGEDALRKIELDLAARVVERFALSPSTLFYDATNFYTFIDTFNTRSTLAQRGKSKEGRSALRILGLALMVTGDFEVPLFHRLYPGNHNDPTSFRSVVDELVERARTVHGGVEDLTLVFDKGNNTEDTLAALRGAYHVVGSLVPQYHKELLEVPREAMRRLDPTRYPKEVVCHRTQKTVFGRSFTVLVVWNEGLYETQRKTVEREVTKCARKLSEEQARLARWHSRGRCGGHRPTPTVVRKRIAAILRGQHMKALFEIDITPHSDHPELGCLDWRVSSKALADLERRSLGKTLLFTDRADWSDEDVVAAYRGQHHVEAAFRQMKDTGHVSFRPTYHWTDQKLRVHAFTCVTALLLCTLLRRRLAQQGIELSVDGMLEALGSVREVHVLLTSGRGRPRVRRTHSELTPISRRLFDELELAKHLR